MTENLKENLKEKLKTKNLYLHFDINKTIIAIDLVQNKDLETTLNGVLAEFTYNTWDSSNIFQSYYKYVTTQVSQDNPHLERHDQKFKELRSQVINNYATYLEKNYKDLHVKYLFEKEQLKIILTNKQEKEKESLIIFPSFYKVLTWLNENYFNKYAIHLRTFGKDREDVVKSLSKLSNIKFKNTGVFTKEDLLLDNNKVITKENIFDFFNNKNLDNYAIQDDFKYWESLKFNKEGGKPFPINKENKDIYMFFDDNIGDPDRTIVKPIDENCNVLDINDLIKSNNIICVNTKDAILDENYFIDFIKNLI
jgi:hypothetical protein